MPLASVSQALRYFYEVARAGSFRRAGERLNVAASALSRQVTLLEAELNVPLFERRPGRGQLRLTAAGEILLHRVRLSLNELEVATQAIDALKGLRRGEVAIGVNDSLARDFLPGVLTVFHAEYPGIDFRVVVGNTPALLDSAEQDEIDMLIAYNVPPRNALRSVVSLPLGLCVLMAADHPLAARKTLRISDCVEYPWALPDSTMFLAQIQDRVVAGRGFEPRAILRTNSFELIRDMVATGMAISIQTHFLLRQDPNRSHVVTVPLSEQFPIQHALAFCVRAGRDLPATTAAFVEVAAQELTRSRVDVE